MTQLNRSLSSVMRTFYVAVPSTFVIICILNGFGFLGASAVICGVAFFTFPRKIIDKFDD